MTERRGRDTLAHEPAAPFGGFRQSGIGREYGRFGLEAFLEPKSVLGVFPQAATH